MNYVIAIDQSTSGTKALLVNSQGKIVHKAACKHEQFYPQPSWVEHDPLELYENVKYLLKEMPNQNIKAISITNQRETVVVWDQETGLPVYNAIVWQCRRTTPMCKTLIEQGYEKWIQTKTGLTLDAYFSATKVKWILDNVQGLKEKAIQGRLLMGTIDSWLIWKLTNGAVHATDYTNASRTLLFNIQTLTWDPELLDLFEIPVSMLPVVKSSNDKFGVIGDPQIESLLGTPISGVIGDSQGALFGQKCFEKGMAKATYGTGTSVLMYTGKPINGRHGLVTSISWGINGHVYYALEGIIHSTGDTTNWLKDQLGLIHDMNEMEPLAKSLTHNQGVYLVPAFVGLGAPYWNSDARAAILGMNRNTGKAHIVRAALESTAYQVKDVIELLQQESNIEIQQLKVDGGATENQFLMQFQADLLKVEVCVSEVMELSAMGSAYLAGLGVGIWKSMEEINQLNSENMPYFPTMTKKLRDEQYAGWKKAVSRVLIK